MNPNKPIDELEWKKDSPRASITRTLTQTIYFDKRTGKKLHTLTEVREIPPTTHKRKNKK